ncbi:hypothetical protein [Arthrobacter sp. TMS1-12-1]
MTGTTAAPAPARVIATAVGVAVLANLVLFLVGVLAGAGYAFTSPAGPATVDAVVVAAFTIIPLALGLAVVAVLRPRWPWVVGVALIVAPVLEIGTIFALTIPADFDGRSTVALALCHLALVPVTVEALRRLRVDPRGGAVAERRRNGRRSGSGG